MRESRELRGEESEREQKANRTINVIGDMGIDEEVKNRFANFSEY